MSQHISVKTLKSSGVSLKQMYKETQTYLKNIGFTQSNLMAFTEKDNTFRSFLFVQGDEKVVLEYNQDNYEENLKLHFNKTEIKFIHDILLMRFNQIARNSPKKIYIFNN